MTENPNSALIWLPAVRNADLYFPYTGTVHFDPSSLMPLLYGLPPRFSFPWTDCCYLTKWVHFPLFVRTDLSSAKHRGPLAYKAESINDLKRCISITFEDSCLKDLKPSAFLLRRWLDLMSPFTAFHGHKIAREWRVFVIDGKVRCMHFYWPQKAIRFYDEEPFGWQSDLKYLARDLGQSLEIDLTLRAERVCAQLPGRNWSVDFACDSNNIWWLIDMALAEESWHPEHEDK